MQPGSTEDAVSAPPSTGTSEVADGPPEAGAELPDADVMRRVADALEATDGDSGGSTPAITVRTDEGGPLLPRRGN
jgi:hypothetical protein